MVMKNTSASSASIIGKPSTRLVSTLSICLSRLSEWLIIPVFIVLQAAPVAAFIPLVTFVYGIGMTAKTLRGRLKQDHLGLDESERVLRSTRVMLAASDLFGGFDQAREYLHTKSFALGGARPIDLIQTAEGERIVLDELHAQAHSAPL